MTLTPVKSATDLGTLKEKAYKNIKLRIETDTPSKNFHILVCGGAGCAASKSRLVQERFEKKSECVSCRSALRYL